MKKYQQRYQYLSILAFAILVLLIINQISWLNATTKLQREETHQKLKRLVDDIALAINGINHTAFHANPALIEDVQVEEIVQVIDSIARQNGIPNKLHYGLMYENANQLISTNAPDDSHAILESDIKACMSCIISFWVAPNIERRDNESEEAFRERLSSSSTFQYFRPTKKINAEEEEEELFLSLHYPHAQSRAVQATVPLFISSIAMMLILLYLFNYLLQSLSKHKKLVEVKNDFFNNMTHEFKTPLSSIRLASKVLLKSKDKAKEKIYAQLIEKESLRLERQVDRLLDLSLLDSHALSLESVPVNLTQVIQEVPQRLKVLIEKQQAALQLDIKLRQPQIKGDYDHLLNCFCNLVENSLKYGRDNLQIQISASEVGHKKRITFRDNGPGIPTQFKDRIFDRFFRIQQNDQYKGQGFGIGLSYVKSIILAHKGTINLNTTYASGVEFIIEL